MISKGMRKAIREEQEKLFVKMSNPDINQKDWDTANEKYQAYSEMLKPTWKFSPDTVLVVAGNLIGILAILNFEKLDIVRSKAIGFVLKGKI